MLWVILKRRVGPILDGDFAPSIGKTALASFLMWGLILLIGLLTPWDPAGPFGARLAYLALCIAAGGAAFLTAAYLLKSPDMAIMLEALRRRILGRGRQQDRSRISFG
jgi:hypothetical protein